MNLKSKVDPNFKVKVTGKFSPSWDLFRDGLTQSLLSTYLICPERARLAYVEMLSERETPEWIDFGNIIHEALEAIYSNKDRLDDIGFLEGKLLTIEDKYKREGTITEPYRQEKLFGWAYAILKGYFQKWGSDLTELDWVELEREFEVEYKTFPIKGKIDGVFRKDGKLWIYDTKTKGQIDEEAIANTLGYDLQVNLYMWAASQIYGEEIAGCVYNVVRRPALRQGGKEAFADYLYRVEKDVEQRPDFYFVRFFVEPSNKERQLWKKDFDNQIRALTDWVLGSGYHYRNSGACYAKGPCPFIPICSSSDFSTVIKREKVFPELE